MDKQPNLDQLFRLTQQDQVVQSFEQTKERFISSATAAPVNKTKTTQVFTKKWIIMLATVSTISLSVFLLWNSEEPKNSNPKTPKTHPQQVISKANPAKTSQETAEAKDQPVPVSKPAPFLASMQELVTELPLTSEIMQPEKGIETQQNWNTKPPKFGEEDPYQFPKLTEEEIAITKKKKKAMLKALVKYDKNAYAYIPSGTFDYNGKQVSVQAFYMGIGEVTNFEYRTFLFDLIIQGRKDEFLKAKPDQTQWTKLEPRSLPLYEEHYFSHKAYNDYPVVNVSREGAELYCKWLSQEVRKSVGDEKQEQYNDVRLPLRVEWVKAASNEGKMLPYPWGGPFARNSKGLILANYARTEEEIRKEEINNTGPYVNLDVTAPSRSYWPNEAGIYNLSGNVAEMVYEGMERTEPGTAGGSWRSSGDDIKIYAPDPNKGVIDAKPTIGFRVVSTYLILNKP